MSKFLLQVGGRDLEDEENIVRRLVGKNNYIHSYLEKSLQDISDFNEKGFIPIGTIEFVTKYLSNAYGIERENPIEVPKYLQTEEFLKRYYKIVTWDKVPRYGKFFLKDVSELKKFGQVITAEYFGLDEVFGYKPMSMFDSTLSLSKEHLYQVSSVLCIKSEYRVYVIDHRVVNICNYNGDPMMLPDTDLINKVVGKVMLNERHLNSYTIDVAVGDFGTALLEIHNFSSVGLYSTLWGMGLLYAYVDGMEYLLEDNGENKFL